MKQKNMWTAIVAVAVVLAFVMPVTASANVGTIKVTSSSKNAVDINNNIGGTMVSDTPREDSILTEKTVAPAVPLTRGTVYVDDNQLPAWYDATHVHTIQEGVTNATVGDTVYVYNGTYFEHVTVTKQVDLIGESRNNVIVNGSGSGNVFYITTPVTGVSISTFTITNGLYGINITGSSNNTITNCDVHHNVGYGIYLDNSADNEITNCNVYDQNTKYGIYLSWSNNNSITNCNVYNNNYGIYLEWSNNNDIINCNADNHKNGGIRLISSSDNIIVNCTAYNTITYGILLQSSSHNTVTNCDLYNNGLGMYLNGASYNTVTNCSAYNSSGSSRYGIYLNGASYNTITNCDVYNNLYGLYLTSATGNTLRDNTIYDNAWNFVVSVSVLSDADNDIDTSNTVNGKPIYYLRGLSNQTYDETFNIGFLGLVSCTNITVRNLDIYGIVLANVTHSTISNVNTHNARFGITAPWLSNSSITNCNVYDNDYGMAITYAYNNVITNCSTYDNRNYGMNIGASFYNNVTNCSTYNNSNGYSLSSTSSYNRITDCSIFNNRGYGIQFSMIGFTGKSNRIYHNNFVNIVAKNAHDKYTVNFWNDSYPSGGNYWGDYTGVDIYSGPGQNISGSDGIGDTPFSITGGTRKDYYPLMNPLDTAPPIITKVKAIPQLQASSAYVNITCNVIDNIMVDDVKVNISGPYGFNIEALMTKSGSLYYCNQTYALAGAYQYFIWANDTHGNIAVSNNYTFSISDLPISAVNPLPTWEMTVPFTVTATAYDSDGVNNVTLYYNYSSDGISWTGWTLYGVDLAAPWSWSFTGADGYYRFYSIAVDIYGITENPPGTADASTGLDTTKPVTIATLTPLTPDGQQGWYITPVTVTLSATDGLSGVASKWYKIDASAWNIYTAPVTVSSNGNHTVQYRSLDNAGNQENASSIAFKVDTIAPATTRTLQGLIGSQGWYVTNVTITLSASDATSGVNYTKYKLNTGSWMVYTGSFVVTTDGNYTLYYYSVDFAGNTEATKQVAFRIQHDVVPPVTTHHLDGTMGQNNWFINAVTVTLSAVDDSAGVASTTYKLNAGTWTPYTGAFLITGDAAAHSLSYYSVDKVGNTESVKEATLKIDQTKPTITLTVNKTGLMKWLLTATVSDETSGIAKVEFYLDGILLGNKTESPYEWNCTQTGTAQAIVYDNAGNSKVSDAIPFSVDLELNSKSATNNQVVSGSQSQNQIMGSTSTLLRSFCRLFNR
ncbi:MAG: right-handed parallel beta-helix repeat-containing protein [Thermoplasmata archaeon]|nr:right-handed parallel beta-helix repeat-containing protein [Thermoplasmata archaeon]